jgi:HemK-related putative methylase
MNARLSRVLLAVDRVRFWPRRAAARLNRSRLVLECVGQRSFVVMPGVFNPVTFRSGRLLAEFIDESPLLTPAGAELKALDLGTGSGIQSIFLAARGYSVTAVDINPEAVLCARANASINRFDERIRVLESDLFSTVRDDVFDVVVFNPPFFAGSPQNALDLAWRGDGVLARFASGLADALSPAGLGLVIWSSHAPAESLLAPLERARLRAEIVREKRLGAEVLRIYCIRLDDRPVP